MVICSISREFPAGTFKPPVRTGGKANQKPCSTGYQGWEVFVLPAARDSREGFFPQHHCSVSHSLVHWSWIKDSKTALESEAPFSPVQQRFLLLQQLFQVRLSLPDCA